MERLYIWKDYIYRKIELDKTRKVFEIEQSKLDIAKGFAEENKAQQDKPKRFGYDTGYLETARSLVGMDELKEHAYKLEIVIL